MENHNYPQAEKRPESWMCGNHEVQDDYLYMTNAGDPKVSSWVAEENAYTDAWFQDKKLDEKIAQLKNKVKKTAFSGVTEQDGILYATATDSSGNHSAVILNPDFTIQKVLLNREMLDQKAQVFGVQICPADANIAAFSVLKDGAPRMTAMIRDIAKDETLAELEGTFSFTWSEDGKYICSTDAKQRHDGTTENSLVRWNRETGEIDTAYSFPGHSVFFGLGTAKGGKTFVHVFKDYHDVVMVCVDESRRAVKVLEDETSEKGYIGSIGNKHYFRTDADAPLGKIVCVEEQDMVFSQPVDVIPEGKFPLTEAAVESGKLIIVTLEDVACRMKVYDSEGSFVREVQLPDPMGSLSLNGGNDTGHCFMSFQSFTCPPSLYRYDADTMEAVQVYSQSDDPISEDVEVERRFVTARDGQQILAFVVHKKGLIKDGKRPTMMYGYGGYASSILPCYNMPFLGMTMPEWTAEDAVYVHCILRGGAEYGAKWHEDGCCHTKKNCFYDFIDIAHAVIDDGWTTPEHIAISGGSNGGLLMAALTTIEPSLWKCVIASVPHTDMLHFSMDDRGPMYVTEYGDPRTEEYFEYMKSYSPYHNVREGVKYPAVYVQTGEQDNNVPPYHGKKFAAALQQASAGDAVLLRVLPFGSHDRGTGEYFYKTTAEMQMFVRVSLGMM